MSVLKLATTLEEAGPSTYYRLVHVLGVAMAGDDEVRVFARLEYAVHY
jgi:hypothetical protein